MNLAAELSATLARLHENIDRRAAIAQRELRKVAEHHRRALGQRWRSVERRGNNAR